jgi:hydroxyacylglutathione hydrolase
MESFEDNIEDIIGKAQRGLELEDPDLADRIKVDRQRLRAARRGEYDRTLITQLAAPLQLSADALLARMYGLKPPTVQLPGFLQPIVSTWQDMQVNAWLLKSQISDEALLFDTGVELKPVLEGLQAPARKLNHLAITHTHRDHIALVEPLCEQFPQLRVYAPAAEPLDGAKLLNEGERIEWGGWSIATLATPGHSSGGTSYAIYPRSSSEKKPIAVVVGDALFAGSIGGIRTSAAGLSLRETYQTALQVIRQKLLTLCDDTPLLPGHGPATTVAWEKAHNPFFT